MNCPRCDAELRLSVRQGFEVAHCARCEGNWLDKGILEKITGTGKSSSFTSKGGYVFDSYHPERRFDSGASQGHRSKMVDIGFFG